MKRNIRTLLIAVLIILCTFPVTMLFCYLLPSSSGIAEMIFGGLMGLLFGSIAIIFFFSKADLL